MSGLVKRFANEEKALWGILINVPKIIFTALYLVFLLGDFSRWFLVACIVLVALSDYLDGRFVALKRSRVRRIANNITDKVILNFITLATILKFGVAIWFWMPFFARDIVVAVGGSVLLYRGKTVMFPHLFSKLALLMLAGLGVAVVCGWPIIYFWLSAVVPAYLSLIDFVGIYLILRRSQFSSDIHRPALFEGIRWLIRKRK